MYFRLNENNPLLGFDYLYLNDEDYKALPSGTVNIKEIINYLKKNNKINIQYIKQDSSDVLKTHGCNKKILTFTKIKIKNNLITKIDSIFKWYKKNKIYKF